MIREDRIFSISSPEEFERIAMEIFHFQAENTPPYREYIRRIGCKVSAIERVDDIPFMPISLFKSHRVLAGEEYQHIFTSSGTSSQQQSRHFVKSLEIYERSFVESFTMFCYPPSDVEIFALLPGYLEREGSSLIYMIKHLIDSSSGGGFYLYDYDKLKEDISHRDSSKKLFLFGVTFALLDLAQEGKLQLQKGDIVMETGGMKGRGRELPRHELHSILTQSFGVDSIASEYGMCECLSQAYSMGEGIFTTPPWMKVLLRDTQNPMARAKGRGAVNIIDLANIYSCSFIQSDDVATQYSDGRFLIEGRLDGSDIRGCNLLIEQ